MGSAAFLPERRRGAGFDVDCEYTFTPECPDELPVADGTEIVPEAGLSQPRRERG